MTEQMKPNAELAYAALDHIDEHPEQWFQGTWYRQTACGTSGCFAGWAVALAGHKIDFRRPDPEGIQAYDAIDGDRSVSISEVAVDDLGIRGVKVPCHLGCCDCGVLSDAAPVLFDAFNSRTDLNRLVALIFGPRPQSYGTGCHCNYLGKGTPEHAPSGLCLPGGERS